MGREGLSRRRFLAGLACGSTAAGLGLFALRRKPKYNVILVVSDSMRRDALGCYGGWAKTPNLDAFADAGARFTNAFVASFPTVLARHDLLTGTHTFTYKRWSPLESSTFTLQRALGSAGVNTAFIGDTYAPFRPQFFYQRDFQYAHRIRGQEDDNYVEDLIPVQLPCEANKLRDPGHYMVQYLRNVSRRRTEEDWFCAQTMRTAGEWLDENHNKQPFFLYVDTFDPHEPWDPPRRYVERYDPGYRGEEVIAPRYDRWREFLTPTELKHCRALYAAEATMVDRWFGHLMAAIERLGLFDNTLVLFISDHGVFLGEHGFIGKGIMRNGQRQNLPLYPEMSRIPLLARFPGCRPGTAIDSIVQMVNLPATVMDFFQLPKPEQFVAPSLWPLLRGDEERVADFVVSAPVLSWRKDMLPNPADRPSITDGRWLLVYSCGGSAGLKGKERSAPLTGELLTPMLFDLQEDPQCLRDAYAANRDRATDMHRWFRKFLAESPMIRDHLGFFEKLDYA
jgi:arylsulfatase A-like enzyme